jgi:hypothetical protein
MVDPFAPWRETRARGTRAEAAMRVFHVKVFDDNVEGTDAVYSGSEFEE